MQPTSDHYHVNLSYPRLVDQDQDQAFADLDRALDKAAESRDTLRADGYNVIEIDDPDDQKAGILRRYHVTEPDGMPIAIIEVRRCRKERHV
jgi:hypothetical protein